MTEISKNQEKSPLYQGLILNPDSVISQNESIDQTKNKKNTTDNCLETQISQANIENSNLNFKTNCQKQISIEELNINDLALFQNPKISFFWRYAVPFCIILNITLFATSSFYNGALVTLFGKIKFLQTKSYTVQSFTLAQSIQDMWNSGVYPLAIIVAITSGAWPYVKLVLMLVTWLVNSRQMNKKFREIFLFVLDITGKWSLIDVYMIVMMLCAFHMEIGNNDASISVNVSPQSGFNLFLLATLFSLSFTHLIISFHRKTIEKLLIESDEKVALCDQKPLIKYGVLAMLITSLVMLLLGAFLKSFSFEFLGMAGYVLQDKYYINYSLVGLAMDLPNQVADPDAFGIRALQVIFLLFALIFPILFLLTMSYLWLVPMKIKAQKTLFRIAEILNAWSTPDVFVFTIFISLTEIRQYAQYMVGSGCDGINDWLKIFEQFHLIDLKGDDKCFDVRNHILVGSWALIVAAVFYFILGTNILRRSLKHLNERIEKLIDKSDPENTKSEVI